MRGAGAAPAEALSDTPLDEVIPACAFAAPDRVGAPQVCFGRYLDVTGDGTQEFLLLQFADGLTVKVQIYASDGIGWSPFGFANPPAITRPEGMFPCQEWFLDALAGQRRRIVDDLTTLPPLLADLDVGGERVIFEYVSSERESEAEIFEPDR